MEEEASQPLDKEKFCIADIITLCIICEEHIEEYNLASVLGAKDCQGLLQASRGRGSSIHPIVVV